MPEGYCRDYINPAEPCTEAPRGRDYFGGDLRGVDQHLEYLQSVGVNTLYFNPIFDAASNHAYDTQDYYKIDPFFGTQKDWENLEKHADRLGIRIVLDGVFNHVSSDSSYFDRYGHFGTVGACESTSSPYRSWFFFTPQTNGPCAGPGGPNTMTYSAWFGFDSLPVLNKNEQAVRDLFYATPNSVGKHWLNQGADGWRLDVMGDGSFPDSFWQQFRTAIKASDADAPIIGELWKKDEILPKIHGDMADTMMNYRFRNGILGFFGRVDNKGFPDDGQTDQPPSLFARKLNTLREDYPDATYYTLMNIMDSHDTKRILWSLTPGQDNREEKEFNAANLAVGKQRLKLATLVQYTIPGAPTVYYGDEVALNGADDPDDRRTFPWVGDAPGGDAAIRAHYTQLAAIRRNNPVFRNGELEFLLTDDANRTLAYGMRTASPAQVAIVAINRNQDGPKTLNIPLGGYLRDGVGFSAIYGSGSYTSSGGHLTLTLPALGGAVLLSNAGQDLTPPAAPSGLSATEGSQQVGLIWSAVAGAASYKVYRSPLRGGGYLFLGTTTGTTYTDTGLTNAKNYHYVVTALDSLGNESGWSNGVAAMPHYEIGWSNLQWPPSMTHTISAIDRTDNAYGQVWIDGVTNQPGPTSGLLAQLGFGPDGSNPAGNTQWSWVEATFNVDAGNNDEFVASLLPETVGTFDYAYRYSTTNGRDWLYADLDGTGNGYSTSQAGSLTVNPSSDTTAPNAPANLHVPFTSAGSVVIEWNANSEPDLHRYEVWRSNTSGGPYSKIANVPGGTTQYSDTNVTTGATYYYVLTAQDTSFNRSPNSAETAGTAVPRQVAVTFNVTVPPYTPMTDNIFIAGSFPAPYPQWDPGGLQMTRLDQTHARITLNLLEGLNLEYKYTRGSWDRVEKGPACEEIANRQLTVVYGPGGTQTVNDTVAKWRDLDNCP
jgi:glycosidase